MKLSKFLTVAITALATPALSEQALDQSQISALITGNTLYVTIPAGSPGAPGAPEGGIVPVYYGKDGSAAALLPSGVKLVGTMKMAANGYCIDWDNGPKNSCSTLERSDESFVLKDAKTGEARGKVFKIATGNPENL